MADLSDYAKGRIKHAVPNAGDEVIAILEAVDALSGAEAAVLDDVTPGTAAASKALVLDANKDIATIRHLTISGNFVTGATTLSEADLAKVDGVTNGTQAAGKAVVADANVNTGVSKVTELHIGATGAETQVTATATELNQLDATVLTAGSILANMAATAGVGITGTADNFASKVEKIGTLFKTTIVIDIDGLNSGGTANDIIGADGAGAAHLGQITAARNGTIFAGVMTCLETPAGGDNDIDLWSAVEDTGVEDTLVTDLTDTQLCNSGDLTNASRIPLTAFPAADEYLYLAGGTGDADATYTAGILVIELWGK